MLDKNHPIIACTHVITGKKNVREVYHENNGDWQFMCGEDNHGNLSDGLVVCASEILKKDSSLSELLDMDRGYYAKKELNKWNIYKI